MLFADRSIWTIFTALFSLVLIGLGLLLTFLPVWKRR
jgi:hypothetical protein